MKKRAYKRVGKGRGRKRGSYLLKSPNERAGWLGNQKDKGGALGRDLGT